MRCSVENWIWMDSFTVSCISLAFYSNDYAKYVRFINCLIWIVMPHACLPTWHLWMMIIHRKLHSTVMIVFSSILPLVVFFNVVFSLFFHIRCYNYFYCIFSVILIRHYHIVPELFYQISLHILLCLFLFSLSMNEIIRKIRLNLTEYFGKIGFNRKISTEISGWN